MKHIAFTDSSAPRITVVTDEEIQIVLIQVSRCNIMMSGRANVPDVIAAIHHDYANAPQMMDRVLSALVYTVNSGDFIEISGGLIKLTPAGIAYLK